MNGLIKGILSGVAIGAFVYSTGYNKGYKHAKREELKHIAIMQEVMEAVSKRIEEERKAQEKESK